MIGERTAFRRHLWYIPVLAAAMALTMVRVLIMARLLDVPGFGQYSAGLLVASMFNMLGCLGLYALLQRDMPMLFARGLSKRAMVLMGQCLALTCIYGLVLMMMAILPVSLAGLSGPLLAAALFTGFSQQVFLIATVESRSHGEPMRFALQNLARALPLVASGSLVADLTGSPGWILLVEALISLFLAILILARTTYCANVGIELLAWTAWRRRHDIPWGSALTLLGISILVTTLSLLDRWLGAELLPPTLFAQYAFAGIVVLVGQALQSMVSASAYPTLARHFVMSGSSMTFQLAARMSFGLLALSAMLSIPLYMIARWTIQRWYQNYEYAIDLLPLLFAVAAFRVADFWSSYATIAGHERLLLVFNLGGALALCAVWAGARYVSAPEAFAPSHFAWLALMLTAGVHTTSAVAAQIAHQRTNRPTHNT